MGELVSIIVPVYNVEKYLERCILSMMHQSYRDIEIILINDGSTDYSLEICQKYVALDRRIKLINQKNAGASAARNAGLKCASGKYIAFIDSDDYVSENYIQNLIFAAKENDLDIVQCCFQVMNDETSNQLADDIYHSSDLKVITKADALNKRQYKVVIWGKIYKKEILNHFQFKEGIIYEDDASYYKFVDKANKLGILNEVLYYYYMSPNSVMRNQKKDKSIAFIDIYHERIDYFKKKQNIELMERIV